MAEVSSSLEEEDLASWADSCINNSPDDSENWGDFRDALTEIIDIHPEIFVSPSEEGGTRRRSVVSPPRPTRDEDMTETIESIDTQNLEVETFLSNSSNEEVSEIVSLLTFESDPSKNSLHDRDFGKSAVGDYREVVEEEEEEEEGETELLMSKVFKDEFMDMSTVAIQDNVVEDGLEEDVLVKITTPQEIFKVWDLVINDDDDEEEEEEDIGLVLQLKKALDESSFPRGIYDDQVVAGKGSIDDLIAGISDLSLAETF